MGKRNVIRIDEDILRGLVEKALGRVIEGYGYDDIGVENLFDIDSLTKKDILSMATDLRVYLMGNGFDSDLTVDGNLIIKEGVGDVMGIGGLRKELGKLGFKQWQIKSEIRSNRVRTVILYADIEKNTDIIKNKMLGYGWTVAYVSGVVVKEGVPLRVMGFDPKEQRSVTKEARKYMFLYHWTPVINVQSILSKGLEPRSENDLYSYPSKVHLLKGDIDRKVCCKVGWALFNQNKKNKDGRYCLIRVDMGKVPEDIEFYGDPRFEYGFFTKETIPAEALSLIGEIKYTDKFNYKGEDFVENF